MGLTIDKEQAILKFGQALVLARSDESLPDEWIERTRRIGTAPSLTFTPVLGTALIARATNDFVDPTSLRDDASPIGYSARSVAKEVLVPCCLRAGIDIRSNGAEPLNNQPFLRAASVSTSLNVKPKSRAHLAYLVESLQRLNFVRGHDTLLALAAFLRARIEATPCHRSIEVAAGVYAVHVLGAALAKFCRGDPEGGKVGQAVVAAIMDLSYSDVRTKRINDPSNKYPGDVAVFDGGRQVIASEVKQRPFSEAEVMLFARRIGAEGVFRGVVAALAQGTTPLDDTTLRYQAHRLHGVHLMFFFSEVSLFEFAVFISRDELNLLSRRFQERIVRRLEELEVTPARSSQWAACLGMESR